MLFPLLPPGLPVGRGLLVIGLLDVDGLPGSLLTPDGTALDVLGGLLKDSLALVDLPQMRLDRIALKAPIEITREGGPFLLYSCVRGGATLRIPLAGGQSLDYPLGAGETMLVPAECLEFQLVPATSNTLLLETSIVRADADPYIDPTADPTPPDAE